jgi:hypothetical protein
MRWFFAIVLLASPFFAAEPIKVVIYIAPFHPHHPKFEKGYLFENPSSEDLIVYARDGARAFAKTLTAPYGYADVLDAAVDQNGGFAVSMLYQNEHEFVRGAIAYLDPTGKQIRTVETVHFLAAQLCYAPTGELWAFGEERTNENFTATRGLYLFRKYDSDGKEIGRYTHRIRFMSGPWPGSLAAFGSSVRLQIDHDRVGALANGYNSQAEWIEIDFQGKLLGQWKLGGEQHGLAFIDNGELYKTSAGLIAKFDRATSTWTPVKDCEPPAERFGSISTLLAADGNAVVVTTRDSGRLVWLAVP